MKRYNVAVFGLYGLVTIVLALPLVLNLNAMLIGKSSDVYINPWADWWTKKAFTEGLDFYRTDYLFYPPGASLVFHSFSHTNAFVSLLLTPLIGHLAAFNVAILLIYVLSGFNMYLLVSYLTDCRPAAFVAGLIFAFFPYHVFESAHPNLTSTHWIPLFVLALIRALRETGVSRIKQTLLAVLWFLLTALSSWLVMIMLGIWTALYLLYGLFFERSEWAPQAFHSLVLLAIVISLIVTPLLWPIIRALVTSNTGYVISSSGTSNDLLSFVTPNRGHPVVGSFVEILDFDDELRLTRKDTGYLGFVALGLAIAGAITAGRRARFWWVGGLVLLVLTLGPQISFNGVPLHAFKLPWAIPIIGVLKNPLRLNLVLFICLAVLSGYGSLWLYQRIAALQSRTLALVALTLVAVLVLLEYLIWPFPTTSLSLSPFWDQLAREEGNFAVANYPRGNRPEKYYMFCQISHNKKIVGGHVSRSVADADNLSIPLLERLGENPAPNPAWAIGEEFAQLAGQGIRHIILHKRFLESDEVDDWRAWFPFQPYYEDEHLLVFRTAPRYGEDFQFATELGDGIGVLDAGVSTHSVVQGESLDVTVVWGSRKAPCQDWTAFLKLVSPTGQEVQRAYFDLFPDWPTSEWGDSAVLRGQWTLQVDPYIAQGGTYAMALGLVDLEAGEQLDTSIELGQLDVQVVERTFEIPRVEIESDAVFGSQLRLLGYDTRQADGQMKITLHWQALQRTDTAYQFFVHMIDPTSEKLVTQADVMPYHWTYPTFWWEAGEIVSDEIALSLADVPQGNYRLEIGVYDPDSGERLLLVSGRDHQQPADRLVLPEMVEIVG